MQVDERVKIDRAVVGQTIPSCFVDTVAKYPDIVALRWRDGEHKWHDITYAQYAQAVARAVGGLKTLKIRPGERIALMLSNRYEFHIADLAIQFLGGVPFSLYYSSSTEQLRYIVGHAEARIAITERNALPSFRIASQQVKSLETLVVLDATESVLSKGEITWESVCAADAVELGDFLDKVKPDNIATIIYTSGTTGPPKGVQLSQYNVCFTAESYRRRAGTAEKPGMRQVSYLPMAHVAERVATYYTAIAGAYSITPCSDLKILREYLEEVRPNAMFGVPRIWEKFYANAQVALDQQKLKRLVFKVGFGLANTPIPGVRNIGQAMLRNIGHRVLAVLGFDDAWYVASGGAPIDEELLKWFRLIGLPLSEVYGMSENTGPMTWDPFEVVPGTVGRALPGVEIKLADDGELMCRGGNVFVAYLKDQEKTDEVLRDGWLYTGDIATIDSRGYVRIIDRKKELIITAGGKNISPGNLEAAIKSHPLVANACAIGDKRPYISALISLDGESARRWAQAHGLRFTSIADFSQLPQVVEEIDAHIAKMNKSFSHVEQIKKFRILDHEWIPDSNELTPTLKLKRRNILMRYELEIEEMYQR